MTGATALDPSFRAEGVLLVVTVGPVICAVGLWRLLGYPLSSPSSPIHLEPRLRTSKQSFLCQQGAPERRNSRLPSSELPQPGFFNSGAHSSTGTSKSGYSIAAPGDLVSSCPSQTQNRRNTTPPHTHPSPHRLRVCHQATRASSS